jgi:hypothetical protein
MNFTSTRIYGFHEVKGNEIKEYEMGETCSMHEGD